MDSENFTSGLSVAELKILSKVQARQDAVADTNAAQAAINAALGRETFDKVTGVLDALFWTLNTLSDYWTDEVQAAFYLYIEENGADAWGIPSIDDAAMQVGAFWRFLRETNPA